MIRNRTSTFIHSTRKKMDGEPTKTTSIVLDLTFLLCDEPPAGA